MQQRITEALANLVLALHAERFKRLSLGLHAHADIPIGCGPTLLLSIVANTLDDRHRVLRGLANKQKCATFTEHVDSISS